MGWAKIEIADKSDQFINCGSVLFWIFGELKARENILFLDNVLSQKRKHQGPSEGKAAYLVSELITG
jgi:hypothetical protein